MGTAFTSALVPSPDSTNLSPPVTITYSGGSPVLQINDSGTNKGVLSQITNSSNSTSALYGLTNGSGAGLTGYNTGTVGPAGKFGILNSSSSQPGVFTTTNGTGSALLGTITTAKSIEPAILGQNSSTTFYGIGVEGNGGDYGVYGSGGYGGLYGTGTYYGLIAETSTGTGVYSYSGSGDGLFAYGGGSYGAYVQADSGVGLYSYSNSNYGISAESDTGTALTAKADGSGYGVRAQSNTGDGIYATSTSGYALVAQTTNSYAIVGEDFGNGKGVYGYSYSGYAGYFVGNVIASSYATLSDRNAKTKISPIDGKVILEKVSNLPVSSWVFKDAPQKNHVGPMAQDFHAAFGLDGDDDKHINLTDIAGVSLAAIKELNAELKQKDAKIAALEEQMKSMGDGFSARMAALEQQQQRFGAVTQTVSLRKEIGPLGE